MKHTYGFIGCGNMGSALIRAVASANGGNCIAVADHNESKTQKLKDECGVFVSTACDIAAECEMIFLGVKPQAMQAAINEIAAALRNRTDRFLLVSMAAGITASSIASMAGGDYPVIRIMPNTPCEVGRGIILYSCGENALPEDEAQLKKALSAAGIVDRLPEGKIDAAAALSGCGPAFVYMFIESLADGAVECGLTRDKANLYAALTVAGAAEMAFKSDLSSSELKNAVCSPGGTTIAGVHALESAAFRAAVMSAVKAAYDKTASLKK